MSVCHSNFLLFQFFSKHNTDRILDGWRIVLSSSSSGGSGDGPSPSTLSMMEETSSLLDNCCYLPRTVLVASVGGKVSIYCRDPSQ